MRKLILIMLMICSAGTSHAMSGYELKIEFVEYEKANGDYWKTAHYSGFVDGITEATNGFVWCPPSNTMLSGQFHSVIGKYLNDNPAILHLSASELVMNALRESFPCKKK